MPLLKYNLQNSCGEIAEPNGSKTIINPLKSLLSRKHPLKKYLL